MTRSFTLYGDHQSCAYLCIELMNIHRLCLSELVLTVLYAIKAELMIQRYAITKTTFLVVTQIVTLFWISVAEGICLQSSSVLIIFYLICRCWFQFAICVGSNSGMNITWDSMNSISCLLLKCWMRWKHITQLWVDFVIFPFSSDSCGVQIPLARHVWSIPVPGNKSIFATIAKWTR